VRGELGASLRGYVDQIAASHLLALQLPPREARQYVGGPHEAVDVGADALAARHRIAGTRVAAPGLIEFGPVGIWIESGAQLAVNLAHYP
jgi:hypothetical protein